MKRLVGPVLAAALSCLVAAPSALAQTAPLPGPPPVESDLLAIGSGATVHRFTSQYDSTWQAVWLFDENPETGWASSENAPYPQEIVVALPERSELRRFVFDSAKAEGDGYSVREIEILVSDQGPDTGYKSILRTALRELTDGQELALPAPAVGRWVKIVVRSNFGNPRFVELMSVRGYGVPLTSTPLANVSGTYDSPYGKFHLAQDGAHLYGCYEHDGGLVEGGLEAHVMRLTWYEEGDESGPALMVAAPDGKGFIGYWRGRESLEWHNDWTLRKVSADVGSCPHWSPKKPGSVIATGLAKEGRIRLYGINFDTDSDKVRPDAKSTLDQLVAAMKANAGWKLTIEGHTDASGNAARNRDLSARRAAAVKAALVQAGIAADRLVTAGLGQDRPAAGNDTVDGRALNRRVEVVRN